MQKGVEKECGIFAKKIHCKKDILGKIRCKKDVKCLKKFPLQKGFDIFDKSFHWKKKMAAAILCKKDPSPFWEG